MSNQSSTGKHTYDVSLETQPDGSCIAIAYNPWLATSGIFKDDPYFDEMLVHIDQYRKDLNRDNGDDS
jgi:hypothetical protein